MPATMMHLLAGKRLCPSAGIPFFLGCILPDCVDRDRALKDRLHFRTLPPAERPKALVQMGKELSLRREFDQGVLWHFYLDYLWDNGPQKRHRELYKGENWFLDYRHEISLAGSYIAHTEPWAQGLWEELYHAPAAFWQNSLGLTEEDIRAFLEFNFHWHTEVSIGPSAAFPPEAVESFTLDACTRFRRFLRENALFIPNL